MSVILAEPPFFLSSQFLQTIFWKDHWLVPKFHSAQWIKKCSTPGHILSLVLLRFGVTTILGKERKLSTGYMFSIDLVIIGCIKLVAPCVRSSSIFWTFAGIKRKNLLQTMLHFIHLVLMSSYVRGKLITLHGLWNFPLRIHLERFHLFL